MKNRVDFKKCLTVASVIILFLTIFAVVLESIEYASYRKNFNVYVGAIVEKVKMQYPNVDTAELIDILSDPQLSSSQLLKIYGIDIDDEAVIIANDVLHKKFVVLEVLFMVCASSIISSVYLIYINSKEKKIKDVTKLIERINDKDYSLDIALSTEDELSILRSELYKTTIVLKEQAENSTADKLSLKDSLSDISHQLKTPLTSMMISLDNMIDNPEMDTDTRTEFLMSIKRETTNINFLVQALLKLSRLDTNTVNFIDKKIPLSVLLEASIKNVAVLADLKNIKLALLTDEDFVIKCDESWQIEAITNILKNAIEHSSNGGKVSIRTEDNKLYTSISIHNAGEPIDKRDLPHIFERFYRGKNATPTSVGIGLALAKSIIAQESGSLEVESSEAKGTTFTIKYYKR